MQVACYDACMPRRWYKVVWKFAFAIVLSVMLPSAAFAAGTEPGKDLQADPAPCLAAITANDDGRIVPACSALIDNDKAAKPDRIKALIARGGVFEHKEMFDSAIADYDAVLRLDPTLADIFNA